MSVVAPLFLARCLWYFPSIHSSDKLIPATNKQTMVFTHLPSAVCLALIPVPSHLPLSLTFLVLRACSQNMDVAPRSAFLAKALPADKRTAIMGSINVVKTCSQSLGPLITGLLADHGLFGVSFTIAGILKCVYDLGMLFSFAGQENGRRASPSLA